MTPVEAAWQAVVERPDDDSALHVLADALSEIGDPLGELIRLGLAADVELGELHAFVAKHATHLLGDELRLHTWSPVFERGLMVRAGAINSRAELEALLSRPIARLLRDLRVHEEAAAVTAVVTKHPALALQRLTLTSPPDSSRPFVLAPLLDALPRLRRLHLGLAQIDWQGARQAGLETLGFEYWPRTQGVGVARFPSLDALYLTLPFTAAPLAEELLEGVVTPSLKTLTLAGALWPAQLEALASSPLLQGLRALHLMGETATGWYPVLLKRAERFRHLDRIAVRPDSNHPEWVTAVRELLPNVSVISESPGLPTS